MKDKIKVAYSKEFIPFGEKTFSEADLVILGRRTYEKLSYKEELDGTSSNLADMRKFSKNISAPCFIAVKSDDYGRIKRSVAVFENGKLLAVCDANLVEKNEASSFGYKVVKTSVGKIGVAVSKDILNPDCLKSLSLCESELIVNLYVDIYDYDMTRLIPSLGYLYGLPIISCGAHGAVAADGTGKTCFCSLREKDDFTLFVKRKVKDVTVKTISNY